MPNVYTASSAAKKRRWYIPVLISAVVLAGGSGCALARPAAGEPTPVSVNSPLKSSSKPPKPAKKAKPAGAADSTPAKITENSHAVRPVAKKRAGVSIVYFRVKQKPTCESGTDAVRFPGRPVVLEWKVKGAAKATLAVDGPGLYGEYGAKDSATLDFPCAGPANTYVSHRYTLTVKHGHVTKKCTIHVKARVNELATL
ncbi:hypothetical protein GCM10020358_72010 [Amorphoplanes nipponensis]|uniref:Uncharacterized protein n=1 Tax=Actinoplanes nipponensis TaxID=135950 RepID=A0A919JCT9_9ACTN|nr:hypothetical protein [Actinoplanes nipponensis]GIE47010.1 hypothetical protein Ani05nite_05440 [Actinoplanes nipponensis]